MALIDQFTDDDLLTWAAAFVRLECRINWPLSQHLNEAQRAGVGKLIDAADEFLRDQPQPKTPRSTVAK